MKIAFTVWNNRVAPLFDVARQLHVIEFNQGRIVSQFRAGFDGQIPARKAKQLAEMGVQTLVCGAISRSMQFLVTAYGVELIAFINGDLQEVIDAWQCGKLRSDAFLMPGCRGRYRNGPYGDQEVGPMFSNQRGTGQGQGGGKGRRGQGRGRKNAGGPAAATDMCVCPQCGNQEPHQRGVPCMQKKCAKCGAAMTRQ
jgi:predicted Fe-Mo cluster-binding NifX family protein